MLAHAIMHGMAGTENDKPQFAFELAQASAKAGFQPAQELLQGLMQCVLRALPFASMATICLGFVRTS